MKMQGPFMPCGPLYGSTMCVCWMICSCGVLALLAFWVQGLQEST